LTYDSDGHAIEISDEKFFLNYHIFNESTSLFLRFGLFLEPKVENRPQFMTVVTDQIGVKNGDINSAYSHLNNDNVRVRIVQVRDDVITEPVVKVGRKEEAYQEQLYTRPGLFL
jgi:hypothetical protein